jgi:putative spermidine/putrescine transport system permease protein
MAVVTALYLAYLLLPMALLLVGSFGGAWTNTLLPHGTTLGWYAQVWGDPSFRRAFLVSLEVVAATCVGATLLGLPLAYALHAGGRAGVRAALRLAALLPIAVPPIVLGFGFILVFSSDWAPWLGTLPVLIAGHLVLTLPYLVQALVGDMRHLGLAELEAAAESLGAAFPRRFVEIVVPSLRHSLLSGLIMVAALSIGEFQLSNLVAGFLSRPYPVVLLQAFYGATGFACAATVVLLGLALLAAVAGALAGRTARGLRPALG